MSTPKRSKSLKSLVQRFTTGSNKKHKTLNCSSSTIECKCGRTYSMASECDDNRSVASHFENDVIYEEDSLHGQGKSLSEIKNEVESLQKRANGILDDNMKLNQKVKTQQQTIDDLLTQLEHERKRFADERQNLIDNHREELKRKDAEMVEYELNTFQTLSLKSPPSVIENKSRRLTGIGSTVNSSFGQSVGPRLSQNKYNSSMPNDQQSLSNDLMSRNRHKNLFSCSDNRLLASVPKGRSPIPLDSLPNLIPMFKSLVMCAFRLHNSSDTASMFANNWLENGRPRICSTEMRISFSQLLGKLDSMKNEDIEHLLKQTVEVLNGCSETIFGLKRDMVELHKRAKRNAEMEE